MAIDFSALVYLPNFDVWARSITVYPVASQPGGGSYVARGIFDTRDTTIQTDTGLIVISDQETILDIRQIEFAVLPEQGDQIFIPAEGDIPEEGMYEITDSSVNGGGEMTLVIRKYEAPAQTFRPGK